MKVQDQIQQQQQHPVNFLGYVPAYEDKQEKQSFSQQQWNNIHLNWSKEFEQQQHPVNLFRLHPAKTSIIKQKIEILDEQLVHLNLYNTTLFFPE